MSKFCSNCGNTLEDTAVFCDKCGTSQSSENVSPVLTAAPVMAAPEAAAPAKKGGKAMPIVVAIVILALIGGIVFGCIKLFGGDSDKASKKVSDETAYQDAVNQMFDGMEKGDWDMFVGSMPKEFADYLNKGIEAMGASNGDEYLKTMTDMFKAQYGDDFKIDATFGDKKELSKEEIDDFVNEVKSTYDVTLNIEKAYEVEIDATIKGSDSENTDTEKVTVIKIDGKWYVFDKSFI